MIEIQQMLFMFCLLLLNVHYIFKLNYCKHILIIQKAMNFKSQTKNVILKIAVTPIWELQKAK